MKTNIRKVENLRDPDKPWSLQWQSPTMPAPAFWYYPTEEEAKAIEQKLRERMPLLVEYHKEKR
jgi:hypothetical protein